MVYFQLFFVTLFIFHLNAQITNFGEAKETSLLTEISNRDGESADSPPLPDEIDLTNATQEFSSNTFVNETNANDISQSSTTISPQIQTDSPKQEEKEEEPIYDENMKEYKPRFPKSFAFEYSGYQYLTEISQFPSEPTTIAIGGRIAVDFESKLLKYRDWIDEICLNCDITVWLNCSTKGAEYYIRDEVTKQTKKSYFKQPCMMDYVGVTSIPKDAFYVRNDTCKQGPCIVLLWEGDYFHPVEFYFTVGTNYDTLSKIIIYQRNFQGIFTFALPSIVKEFSQSTIEALEFQTPSEYSTLSLRENPAVPIFPQIYESRKRYTFDLWTQGAMIPPT